jgi:hypothetical protein
VRVQEQAQQEKQYKKRAGVEAVQAGDDDGKNRQGYG